MPDPHVPQVQVNQCDGCARHLPVADVEGHDYHFLPSTGEWIIVCEKERYKNG